MTAVGGATILDSNKRILLGLAIAGGLAIRAHGIDSPVFGHHWLRQIDSLAIARNFAEEDINILFPRVDWRGASTGYVEAEFQIYTYLIALIYNVFGTNSLWATRSLNMMFYLASTVVLFDFATRMFDHVRALLTVFFYCFSPLAAYFTFSIQPDTLMVLTTLCVLNYFWRWCDHARVSDLCVSAFALSLGILIKPLNVYLGAPLLFLALRYFGWRALKDPRLWAYGLVALIPAAAWYRHAYQLWVDHGNSLFRAYSDFNQTALWSKEFPRKIISSYERSYSSELVMRGNNFVAAIGGILPLVVGARAAIQSQNGLLLTWTGAFALTMVVFAYQHAAHDYYQLPLVIVASLLMADGIARLWAGTASPRLLAVGVAVFYLLSEIWMWRIWHIREYNASKLWFTAGGLLTLLAFSLYGRTPRVPVLASMLLVVVFSAWQTAWFKAQAPWYQSRQAFGEDLNRLTQPSDRIVIAQKHTRRGWFQHRTAEGELIGYMPTDFYLSHRKGWSVSTEHAVPAFVEHLREKGATHIAAWCCQRDIQHGIATELPLLLAYLNCAQTPLRVTENYFIFQLNKPRVRTDGSLCSAD